MTIIGARRIVPSKIKKLSGSGEPGNCDDTCDTVTAL